MKVTVILSVLACILGSKAFIIPDELPSILSVIYSNIPTLKKGTDSRLGWGFRLGDRADFQVMLEIGPQTNTQPLANQGDGNSNSKRNTMDSLTETLYAQRQHEKKQKEQKLRKEKKKEKIASTTEENSPGAQWLKNWSKSVSQNEETKTVPLKPKPGLAVGEIDAKSVIPDDDLPQKKPRVLSEDQTVPTTLKPSETPKEQALDDVSLD